MNAFKFTVASAICLTQALAGGGVLSENTIVKSGVSFDWKDNTELTIPVGVNLNIAGTLTKPANSDAIIYVDGILETENTASLNLENVTIKSKFLEEHPGLSNNGNWEDVPIYTEPSSFSKYFPKFDDGFYQQETNQTVTILNKLGKYNNWYEVSIANEESPSDSKIAELKNNLISIQKQIAEFDYTLENVNGKNIATFAALNSQLANAAVLYATENPYIEIGEDPLWVAKYYADMAKMKADQSKECTANDIHKEAYAFAFAFESLCWAYLSWEMVQQYDSSGIAAAVISTFNNNPNITTFNAEFKQLFESKETANHNDIEYHSLIHCHWVGDFTTKYEGNTSWTFNEDTNIYNGTNPAIKETYQYDVSTQTFSTSGVKSKWSISTQSLTPIISSIIAAMPSVKNSKSNQELQTLTARYY